MSAGSQPLNFLVSSAGRRGELVKILQEVVDLSGSQGWVFTADRSPLTAAGWLSDGLDLVPSIAEPGFVEALLDICSLRKVTHLVPTIDTELPVLAANRERFAARGTNVWVSSPEAIAIAQDKRRTNRWLKGSGFPAVDQVDLRDSAELLTRYPLIAKPARGSSSVGLRRLGSPDEVDGLDPDLDYVLETVAPGSEFTVDVLVDRTGRCRSAVPRQRLETRAGEVSKARTVEDQDLIELAMSVADELPGAFGVLNVQIFKDNDGVTNVIEINARFGGGFPLTWRAGAQMPLWLVEDATGAEPTASLDWLDAQVMLRYDASVLLDCRP